MKNYRIDYWISEEDFERYATLLLDADTVTDAYYCEANSQIEALAKWALAFPYNVFMLKEIYVQGWVVSHDS